MLEGNGIKLDRVAHRVTRFGREVNVGPTEYRLLEQFMENMGRVLSRSQLLDGTWGAIRKSMSARSMCTWADCARPSCAVRKSIRSALCAAQDMCSTTAIRRRGRFSPGVLPGCLR